MKSFKDLSINDKINVKQYCMNQFGKQYHTRYPNFLHKLNELHLIFILSAYQCKFN